MDCRRFQQRRPHDSRSLFIFGLSRIISNRIQDVWLSRNQIDICTPHDPIPKLAVSSAQAEWAERGRSLFKNGTYRQAVHCFERAGLRQERNVANAYSLQQDAYLLPQGSDTRSRGFADAGEAFIDCATTATVLDEAKAYYRLAGRCYTEVGDYQRAGDLFLTAEDYTGSAMAYRKAENFDEAVSVVRRYDGKVDADTAESIIAVAKLHYFRDGEVK